MFPLRFAAERNSSSEIKCRRMIPSRFSVDENHKKCAQGFRCGNQTYLNYPFWIPERKECGHPDYEVNCSGHFAEFSFSSVKLQILDMKFGIIKLARKDYHNNLCPRNPENANTHDILPLSRDTMLSILYYNCSDPVVNVPPGFHIRELHCDNNIGGRSYFVSSASNSWDGAILEKSSASCERNVSIPVSRSALRIEDGNPTLDAIKKAFNHGFELVFNSDCLGCVTSGGICGHQESSRAFVCYCVDKPDKHFCHSEKAKTSTSEGAKLGIGFAFGLLGATLLVGSFLCFIRRRMKQPAQSTSKELTYPTCLRNTTMEMGTGDACGFLGFQKRETSHHPRDHKLKALLQLKQYSYAEVKKITKSFSHTVGKGGFGTVYGGNLCNGRKVAVKVLKDFKSNGEDFINEVASMSQTSHVNIVTLLGFCYEGHKRAIVYEFLENGSLDQFIFKKKSLNLDMSTLYGIALGVARGLEYLHHGCRTRIVHFDIKPQNILLDDNLCPKVSDFGLAKLCERRESILSLLDTRGTVGYIAPEVFSRMYGRVSHKSDVYSYGMLVLEMIGVRNKETVETAASDSSSTYFPDWIYKDLENGEYTWVTGDDIKEEKEMAKKMILVGLWCIQPCPLNRPPMTRVVEMMEGSLDAIEVPPKPSMHISTTPLPESSGILEEHSNNSEELSWFTS